MTSIRLHQLTLREYLDLLIRGQMNLPRHTLLPKINDEDPLRISLHSGKNWPRRRRAIGIDYDRA